MATEVARTFVTLKQYNRMVEEGVFDEDRRVELIRGEIVKMASMGPTHRVLVLRLTELFAAMVLGKAHVSVQIPIDLPAQESSPEPDVFLLRWRKDFYAKKRPDPVEDVLLVIEVSESTLKYDRTTKATLYAEAGIKEMWLVNLTDRQVEVYTQPSADGYGSKRVASSGDDLSLPDNLGHTISVDEILGEQVTWEGRK